MTAVTADDLLPFSVLGERRRPTLDELRLVDVGALVFSLNLEDDTDADFDQVQGGTVIEVTTSVTADGEVQRRFLTATAWRGRIRFDVIDAENVRQIELPNAAVIRSLIRAMARQVGSSRRQVTTNEATLIKAQSTLMGVL